MNLEAEAFKVAFASHPKDIDLVLPKQTFVKPLSTDNRNDRNAQ